jgi:hypothetical protein
MGSIMTAGNDEGSGDGPLAVLMLASGVITTNAGGGESGM